MSVVRKACFAGSWYPGKSSVIKERMAKWFSEVKTNGTKLVKGVIVPHAGWTYSGRIAAESFAQMKGMDISRVVVLGPCHRYYTDKCMLTNATVIETPCGSLDVDMEAQSELRSTGMFGSCSMSNEEQEHSLEIELPFVYELFGNKAKLVMIMVGDVSENKKVKYAMALANMMKDPKTVFVISSDFCHWGSNFDFMYYNKSEGAIWESIEALDREGAEYIKKEDADGFAEYMEKYENTICGHNCIEIYLRALKESGLNTTTEIMKYGQSNKVTSPSDTSVSYCALSTFINWFCFLKNKHISLYLFVCFVKICFYSFNHLHHRSQHLL